MSRKLKAYVISCSSDSEMTVSHLYVHGGNTNKNYWLPGTMKEAIRRLNKCQRVNQCKYCDAEIHKIEIARTIKTKLQLFENPEKEESYF